MLTKFPWPARKHTGRPEEAVQSDLGLDRLSHLSTVDWCGTQWLGEARWFYTKGMHYAFWSAASVWSVAFWQPSAGFAIALSSAAAFCIWQTVEAGLAVQDAFEREQQRTDGAVKLWQFEEVARRRAELNLRWSRPQFGDGAAEGDGETFTPSADVVFLNPKVNGREPQF